MDLPESEHDQKKRARQQRTAFQKLKRDRLHKASFLVEVVGVVIVFWYAFEAHRQNRLLSRSVAQQVLVNRPVLLPARVSAVGNDAQPIIVNFGKTVARDVIIPGEVISAPKGEPEPHYADCRKNSSPPTNLYVTALAPDEQDIPPDLWKLAGPAINGRDEVLYAVGCVYYKGLDNTPYYTDI